MRVKIGKYPAWWGPYQIAELLCFWAKPVKDEFGLESRPDWVHNFGRFLSEGTFKREVEETVIDWSSDKRKETWLSKFLSWIHSHQKQTVKVKIDSWDTWNADRTLAHIILPLMEQLRKQKHGAPSVDDDDVPVGLKSTSAPAKENEWDTDDNWHKRWDYVLNEMIFAFKLKLTDDWEEEFRSGVHHTLWIKEEGTGHYRMENGPNDTYKFDTERYQRVLKRQENGFRLFGKYYNGLWT